jgi:hypothetical protein
MWVWKERDGRDQIYDLFARPQEGWTNDRNILELDVELSGPLEQVGTDPGGDLFRDE